MDPWSFLSSVFGWLCFGVFSLLVFFVFLLVGIFMFGILKRRYLHIKTRDKHPAAWQVWMQEGSPLTITRVTTNDKGETVVSIRTGKHSKPYVRNPGDMYLDPPRLTGASWGESLPSWHERVRNRKLYLVE